MRSFGSRGLTERRQTLGMRRRPVRADEGVELCELLLPSRARILNLPAQLLEGLKRGLFVEGLRGVVGSHAAKLNLSAAWRQEEVSALLKPSRAKQARDRDGDRPCHKRKQHAHPDLGQHLTRAENSGREEQREREPER